MCDCVRCWALLGLSLVRVLSCLSYSSLLDRQLGLTVWKSVQWRAETDAETTDRTSPTPKPKPRVKIKKTEFLNGLVRFAVYGYNMPSLTYQDWSYKDSRGIMLKKMEAHEPSMVSQYSIPSLLIP